MNSDYFEFTNSPDQTGVAIGVLLGIFQRFIYPVGFPTATFLIVGIVLVQFGERSWPEIGRAFVFLSISTAIVSLILRLIFGGPWF
ncbi:hypothetical protein A4G99_08735 [Haladaptatus sp. R4]|nr:hypothetical protein A4G99_08735 [Haladaptatus sp. R4]